MPALNSRESLIDYAFRALGSPVIEINVDMQQAYDRLDDALQFFAERHFDGVDRCYFDYVVTQQDVDRKYINTDAFGPMVGADASGRPDGRDILSIIRIFPFGTHSSNNFFDIRYQLALNDFFGIICTTCITNTITINIRGNGCQHTSNDFRFIFDNHV